MASCGSKGWIGGGCMRLADLTRKNTLVAGSDGGAEHWAVIALLIESRKLLAASRTAIWPTSLSASSMATLTGARSEVPQKPEESAA